MCLYVRELPLAEGRRLTRVLKTTKTAAYLRRAQVVVFSGQGMRARAIAGRLYLHEEYVRAFDSAVQCRRLRGAATAEGVRPAVEVCAGRGQRHPGGRGHAAARPGPAVHRVVPPETGGPSGALRGGQGAACHHARPHPARPGLLVPTHEDLEGEPRSGLRRQKNASVRSTGRHRRTAG